MARFLLSLFRMTMRSLSVWSVWILLPSLFFPYPVFASDVVIEALHDGDGDAESDDVAQALRQSFSLTTPHHVIDATLARDVLEYHRDDDPTADLLTPAREALEKGKEDFYNFQQADALVSLSRAVELAELARAVEPKAGALLVDALVTRAIVANAEGDKSTASGSIARAFRLNPTMVLDAKDYSPSFLVLVKAEQDRLSREPKGKFSVITDPPAAEVYLNGSLQGISPLELSAFPVGDYVVTIATNRYRTLERRVTISPDETTALKEKLTWQGEEKPHEQKKIADAHAEIARGLFVAGALKADRAIVVDADTDPDGGKLVTARMVDRAYQASLIPLAVRYGEKGSSRPEALAALAKGLISEVAVDPHQDPQHYLDPPGGGDARMLAGRKRKMGTVAWVAIGTGVTGAVVGGILMATSGGSEPREGNIAVRFP